MSNYDFEHMRVETNVPAGVGAEVLMEQMKPWEKRNLGQKVFRFCSSCKRDPEIMAAINAKVEELRAEGFFDAHPPKEVTYESR